MPQPSLPRGLGAAARAAPRLLLVAGAVALSGCLARRNKHGRVAHRWAASRTRGTIVPGRKKRLKSCVRRARVPLARRATRKAACRAALINRAAGLVSLTPSTIWSAQLRGLCLRWKAETEAGFRQPETSRPAARHAAPRRKRPPETATRLNRPCTRRRPRAVPEYRVHAPRRQLDAWGCKQRTSEDDNLWQARCTPFVPPVPHRLPAAQALAHPPPRTPRGAGRRLNLLLVPSDGRERVARLVQLGRGERQGRDGDACCQQQQQLAGARDELAGRGLVGGDATLGCCGI